MKPRLAAVLVVFSVIALLWFTQRHPGFEPPTSQDAVTLSERTEPSIKFPPAFAPEGNPEVPEEMADESGSPAISEAVIARREPIALAAAEEPPSGPEGDVISTIPPVTALENLRAVFRHYNQRFGGNPVGDNAEITAVLNGRNPRQAVLLNPDDGMRLNDRGELVDSWGTPYFFHQISRLEMEIHSAGPDRKLWTADDLVMK